VPHYQDAIVIENDGNYTSDYEAHENNIDTLTFEEKIEKVKELLLYDELNLSEISYKLHYSSVAHLSNQFKKITGLTPSYYKQLGQKRKQNLEDF
jgi:AraC-like DNA-binding protein